MSNGDPKPNWFKRHWPAWVKITGVVVAVGSFIGAISGWWSQGVNALRNRDTKLQAEAIAKQVDKEHDDKVNSTLDQHGKAIDEVKTGVQEIQTHLGRQDVDALAQKQQLNIIESAILTNSAPHILPPPTPTP